MANGLARLGQAARKIFGGKKKVNLREVNTVEKNTPEKSGSGFSRSFTPTPGASGPVKMQTFSPVHKGYRCGRGFLTSSKP